MNPASPGHLAPNDRVIYTWDPSTLALVSFDSAHAADLSTIAGTTISNAVINFVRGVGQEWAGSDTSGWILGPSINSTPAVVGIPSQYTQSNLTAHATFESNYQRRKALVWLGTNDGMMHAFRFDTGSEVLALLPPDLLSKQIERYNWYLTSQQTPPAGYPIPGGTAFATITGEPTDTALHVWGVANSFRFGDVYFPSETPPRYKTVGFLTLGPGGRSVTAIDITHPFPGEPARGLFDDRLPLRLRFCRGRECRLLHEHVPGPHPVDEARRAHAEPEVPGGRDEPGEVLRLLERACGGRHQGRLPRSRWALISGAGFNPCSTGSIPQPAGCVSPDAHAADAHAHAAAAQREGVRARSAHEQPDLDHAGLPDAQEYQPGAARRDADLRGRSPLRQDREGLLRRQHRQPGSPGRPERPALVHLGFGGGSVRAVLEPPSRSPWASTPRAKARVGTRRSAATRTMPSPSTIPPRRAATFPERTRAVRSTRSGAARSMRRARR